MIIPLIITVLVVGLLVFITLQVFNKPLAKQMVKFQQSLGGLDQYVEDVDSHHFSFLANPYSSRKQTLVLLHGFSASKENWLWFAKYLHQDFNIIAPDFLGHGESGLSMSGNYDLDQQAHMIVRLLDKLNIDRFHVIGNSMGGAISALIASRYPERVITATLLNPSGIYEEKSELDHRILTENRNSLIVKNYSDFNEVLRFTMVNPPYIPFTVKRELARKSAEKAGLMEEIWKQLHAPTHDYDFVEELKDIQCPTYVIWGKEDRLLHSDNAPRFVGYIRYGQLNMLAHVGHVPMIEVPQRTAKYCRDFISNALKASSSQAAS